MHPLTYLDVGLLVHRFDLWALTWPLTCFSFVWVGFEAWSLVLDGVECV